jgi:hypothetical protein
MKSPAWNVHFSGGSTSLEQCNSSVSRKRAKNKINCNNITLFSVTVFHVKQARMDPMKTPTFNILKPESNVKNFSYENLSDYSSP